MLVIKSLRSKYSDRQLRDRGRGYCDEMYRNGESKILIQIMHLFEKKTTHNNRNLWDRDTKILLAKTALDATRAGA